MDKYLIVGLGNPGSQYASTRHNIGFEALDVFAWQQKATWRSDRYADVAECKIKGRQLILIKPTTYMNLSGKAVKYWLDKEKIAIDRMLVIVDELALPLESIRIKGSGSDGGHNGLKDIQAMLQTTQYPRLRFGIGNNYPKGMQADFVLGRWKTEEIPIVEQKILGTCGSIEKFVLEGIDKTMNYYNSIIYIKKNM